MSVLLCLHSVSRQNFQKKKNYISMQLQCETATAGIVMSHIHVSKFNSFMPHWSDYLIMDIYWYLVHSFAPAASFLVGKRSWKRSCCGRAASDGCGRGLCWGLCCLGNWLAAVLRDHPTVIKRRFTSVLVVSALSPFFVWTWREFTGVRVSLTTLFLRLGLQRPVHVNEYQKYHININKQYVLSLIRWPQLSRLH